MAAMFDNRQEAGLALAGRLSSLNPDTTVILAPPRGGVPVAREICKATGTPLGLIMVRKIGAPGHSELAAGATADGPGSSLVINREVTKSCNLTEEDVRGLATREHQELRRRRKVYLGTCGRIDLSGKTAVLVDDGIATGATMRAAIKAVIARTAGQAIIAVPVAPQDIINDLKAEADHVICLSTPDPFWAVGQHYAEFPQVSDAEVVAALSRDADPEERPMPEVGPRRL